MKLERYFLCIGKAAGGPEKSDHIFVLAANSAEFISLTAKPLSEWTRQIIADTEPADRFIRMKQCLFLIDTVVKLRKIQELK